MSQVSFKDILGFTMLSGIPCIDPAQVKFIDNYNVRDAFAPDSDESDAQLAANMTENGYITDKPITVRVVGNAAYVIAGHRRVAAANWVNMQAQIANGKRGKRDNRPIRGITFIPEAVMANGEVRSPVEMSYDLELSNTGKPLSPNERGANILKLRAMGETDETIARRLGIGTRWVVDLAKLGRANPRLKALVKAGVIPPSTAVNLVRAHGEDKGTAIAETAAGLAKGQGKANATGKHVAQAETKHGVATKVGNKNKKGADTRATSKTVTVTVAPAVSKTDKTGVTVSTLAGPFKLGKDLTECAIFDASGAELCEVADVGMAKAVLQLLMLGWGVMKGTPAVAPAVTVAPAVSKPARTVPVPDAAAIAAAEAEAEALASAKAARQAAARARVAAQVKADDAKRVAASKANLAAIAAMAKPTPAVAKSRAKSRATVAQVLAVAAKANGRAKPTARK